jgi:DNA-binding transcriptional regulator WhiA
MDFLKLKEEYFNGIPARELFNKYNSKQKSLSGFRKFLIKEFGKRFPTYMYKNVNHDFFDSFGEIQSYLLGFYLADGSLHKTGNSYNIIIGVNSEDEYIIQLFKKFIAPDNPIKLKKPKSFVSVNGKTYTGKPQSIIRISSQKIGKFLEDLGYGVNKTSLTKSLPNLNDDNFFHFLRGYFDGDGCIVIKERKEGWMNRRFQLTSFDKNILEDIVQRLKTFDINAKVYSERNHHHILIQNKKPLNKLYNLMYNNASYYFKRKEEIFKLTEKTLREFRELKNSEPCNA